MEMYSFVSPLREAKLCGVPSCVFEKLGLAAGEKRLWNTDLATRSDKETKRKWRIMDRMILDYRHV
jgi:hypothetical protein